MLKLSRIKFGKRLLFSALGIIFLLGGIFTMTKINQASRADAAGDTAIVKSPMTGWVLFKKDPNSTGYFSNPIQGLSTPVIQVDNAKTGKAYCIDPNTPPPGEVESPSDPGVEYDKIVMDGNDLKSKKIKLAVYIASFGDSSLDDMFTHYPQSPRWDGTADDFIIDDREISGNYPNGVDDNFKYLFMHLAVSYINHDMVFPDDFDPDSCDPSTDIECLYNTYMADVDKSLIKGIDEILTESIEDNADVWLKAQNYTLYGIDTEGENIQNVVWLEADSPQSGNIIVHKCDAEFESTCDTSADAHAAQGGGSLAGITFTVYNNSGSRIYNPFDDNFYNNGDPMAIATTNNSGIATFSNLPVGIDYSVRETSTNASYNLTDTTAKTVNDLTTNGAKVAFSDYVIRGDLEFVKVDENGSPMSDVAFALTSNTTGERHVVVTNSSGVVDTSSITHSTSTNGYDSVTGGSYVYSGYGTWFYGANSGATASVNDGLGALPYDTYTLTELECDANKYCQDKGVISRSITITEDGTPINLGTITNDCAEFSISTTATDTADGDKFVEASATASITDTINYCGKEGLTYTIQGVLMDKVTGEAISTVQEITSPIPAGSDCYTDTMPFSFDASELAGHDIVVFETLLHEGKEVAKHKELDDPSQTVTVISLGTTAVDGADGDKLVEASADSKIVDSIDYCLRAGLEYTIKGALMDKETGKPLTIDGKTVEETLPLDLTNDDNNCGTVQMTFTLDSTELAGKAIVVYESVEYDGNTILEHQNLNDAAQTVNIISLDTYALDKSDEDKEVLATADATVTDHIKYCLVAGTEYTIIGTLMNKNTGEPIMIDDAPVWGTTTVKPEEENCGDLYLDFDFDATGMGGTEIVVFEKAGITSPTQESDDDICLAHDATDPDTCTSYFHELISHADLEDVTQTVLVTTPEPEPVKPADTGRFTSASDTNTGSSSAIVIVVASVTVIGAGYMGFRLFSRKRFFGKK